MNKTAFMRELRRVRKLDIEQREAAIAEMCVREGIEPPPPTDACFRIPRNPVELVECKLGVIRFDIVTVPNGFTRVRVVGDDGSTVE